MDLLNFFFNLHQIMYSFGKQREKIWVEGHFNKKELPVSILNNFKAIAMKAGKILRKNLGEEVLHFVSPQ